MSDLGSEPTAPSDLGSEPTAPSDCGSYTLFDALERVVAQQPESVAVRCGEGSWTFAELRDRAVRLGNAWAEAGIGPGETVAVLADNCHRFVEVYWAAAYLGAVVVPLERRLGDEEIAAILAEVGPAAAVAGNPGLVAKLRGLYPSARLWVTLTDDDPATDDAATGAVVTGDVVTHESMIRAGSARPRPPSIASGAAVAVFYTAAVEGRPRGAVVTHRNLLAQAVQTAVGLGLGAQDSQGLFLPLAHTFGGYLLFVGGCAGVTTTVLATFDPQRAAGLIDAGHVTWFAGFAPMPGRIADAADAAGVALGEQLRLVVGLDQPETIERYLGLGVRWFDFYGQTETAGLVTVGEIRPGDEIAPTFVGRPLLLSRLSLRDQDGLPVPTGEAGEAWVRSDVVVERYWPDEATRLTADGWLRTGDVLRGGPGGDLWFVGRTTDKDLVKPGGLNVYPAEVEAVLSAHPGVARAYVFGLPDPEWRERVCAVVIPDAAGPPPTPEGLRAHCRDRAATFKCPRTIVVALDGPDPSGLTRASARDRYRAQLDAAGAVAANGSGLA